MNIYKISCRSRCGTYFMSYLQSITIVAESIQQALDHCKTLKVGFIYPEKDWTIEELYSNGSPPIVIDQYHDSDY